jgi:hypothetical protein
VQRQPGGLHLQNGGGRHPGTIKGFEHLLQLASYGNGFRLNGCMTLPPSRQTDGEKHHHPQQNPFSPNCQSQITFP